MVWSELAGGVVVVVVVVAWLPSAQCQPWLSLTKPKLRREGFLKYQVYFSFTPTPG